MNFRTIKLFALLTIVAVLTTGITGACGGGQPEELEIPVSVEGESMSPETIKVKQGDMVTFKIQADDAIEFHLHTYDIKKDVVFGEVVDFYFVADATGRFRITFHHLEEGEGEETQSEGQGNKTEGDHEDEEGEEIEIGYLEVGPR